MNYKLINRLDPLIYLGLVLVGFILPEVVYRLFLFDFTAVATENEAMIVRSIGYHFILLQWLSFCLVAMLRMVNS